MSMKRQPDGERLFRITRSAKPRGAVVALHAHDEAQLVFADSGTMQIYAAAGRWLVPPRLAVWIPARVPHQVEVLADTQHWIMRWHRTALRDWAPPTLLDRAFALKVTPLLRALIAAAFAADATPAKVELIVKLVLHELNETPDAPTFLPLPASPIGRRVADLALADPSSQRDLAGLASAAATSVRTISRLFPTETGMTFKAWRQRARIVLAIGQLATGTSISQVAAEAGFASTAAFCFAFRQVTRMTPSSFLDHATRA